MITLQEAFNKNWDWFIVQKKPKSLVSSRLATCMYENTKGDRCGIGCFLPKDLLNQVTESGLYIDQLIEKNLYLARFLSQIPVSLLIELQHLHDCAIWKDEDPKIFYEFMLNGLIRFAKQNHLTIPEVH